MILLFLNLGGGEVFVVILVVLMLFGSDKLPEIAKGLGKGLRELNDAKAQIQNEIQKQTGGLSDEIKKQTSEIQNEIDKAEESIKKQMNTVNNTVSEETKRITDTLEH